MRACALIVAAAVCMTAAVACGAGAKKNPEATSAQQAAATKRASRRPTAAPEKKAPKPADTTYTTFDAPLQIVWESALWVLTEEMGLFLDIENMDTGVIATRWVAGKKPDAGSDDTQLRARLYISIQDSVEGVEAIPVEDGIVLTAKKRAVLVTARQDIEERAADEVRWGESREVDNTRAREFIGRLDARVTSMWKTTAAP